MTALDYLQIAYALAFVIVVPVIWWKKNFR